MTLTDPAFTSNRLERDRASFKPREVSAPVIMSPGNLFMRSVAARAIAQVTGFSLDTVVKTHWPNDLVMRAATQPAMTTTTGWAAELAARKVADQLQAMGPSSAGAQLLQAGLVLSMDGVGSISAPGFTADPGNSAWVAEGQPIPVKQWALTPDVMNPHKLASIAVLTREMVQGSNAEALITDGLVRSAGLALDVVLFGNSIETAAQPAGLRNGVANLTPSNSSDPFGAFFEDMATLTNAVSAVAANGRIYVITGAGRAAGMELRYAGAESRVTILGSAAVGNDMIAVAPAGLVAAFSPDPEVEASEAATLHMEGASPQPVGSAGPARSVWQTSSIAIKVRWPATWILRDPRAVAWLTPTWK